MRVRCGVPIYHQNQYLEVGTELELPPELLNKDGSLPLWAEAIDAPHKPTAEALAGQAEAAKRRGAHEHPHQKI